MTGYYSLVRSERAAPGKWQVQSTRMASVGNEEEEEEEEATKTGLKGRTRHFREL
jgi:hypothetical protein